MTVGLQFDHIPEQIHGVFKGCRLKTDRAVPIEVCSQNVSREGECSPGMLLLTGTV